MEREVMGSDETILNGIRSVLAEVAEVEEVAIVPDAHFVNDLNMDSMLVLEVLSGLEKKFNIHIPEEELPQFVTLNKVYDVVTKLIRAQSAGDSVVGRPATGNVGQNA